MKRLVRHARVLVIDGAKALIFRNEGDAQAPDLRLVRSHTQDNPPTRELGSDKPGRTHESADARRSSMETPDWHSIAEAEFVTAIAGDMNRDLRAGDFETLIVVAPAIALGVYRKAAATAVAKVTMAEIEKDLVKHPAHEIATLVVKALEGA